MRCDLSNCDCNTVGNFLTLTLRSGSIRVDQGQHEGVINCQVIALRATGWNRLGGNRKRAVTDFKIAFALSFTVILLFFTKKTVK